jgi:hypothetical protein
MLDKKYAPPVLERHQETQILFLITKRDSALIEG